MREAYALVCRHLSRPSAASISGYGKFADTRAMVSKCHNPHCQSEFRYFGDGKLFEFPPAAAGDSTELFWLCDACLRTHILKRGSDGRVRLTAKPPSAAKRLKEAS